MQALEWLISRCMQEISHFARQFSFPKLYGVASVRWALQKEFQREKPLLLS